MNYDIVSIHENILRIELKCPTLYCRNYYAPIMKAGIYYHFLFRPTKITFIFTPPSITLFIYNINGSL